jgi:hypothetical protein
LGDSEIEILIDRVWLVELKTGSSRIVNRSYVAVKGALHRSDRSNGVRGEGDGTSAGSVLL